MARKEMDKPEINSSRQELFDHMSQEHGLTLLQSEMMEIEKIVLRSSQLEAMEKDVITHNTYHKFKLWDRIKILQTHTLKYVLYLMLATVNY